MGLGPPRTSTGGSTSRIVRPGTVGRAPPYGLSHGPIIARLRNESALRTILIYPPRRPEAPGTIDQQSLFVTTLAVWCSVDPTVWSRWSTAARKLVEDERVDSGCAEGSWDPTDPRGKTAGRSYSTAVMLLTLRQTYKHRW